MVRLSDFRNKEVISVTDGRRLGFIYDAELDEEKGVIEAFVIPGQGRIFGVFGRDNEYIIPWENIVKVGDDIVLVEVDKRLARRLDERK